MSSPVPLPHPTAQRIGQATAIEQSRAAAEVFASVMAADARPRNEQRAIRSMNDACRMRELAERAFFRFNRGGQNVTGPTVHLARELARCWGNIQYGVAELRRDDDHGQSEMQAFGWDLETNARVSAIFIVPHKRDKRGGPEALTDMRDVYENNANNGARRVREALFAVLPLWYVEQAKALCTKTLEDGGGKPLPQRIAASIEAFAGLGVSEHQLEEKVGRPSQVWTALDLAPLTVIFQSIKRGEATRDEEFPPVVAVLTAAELAPPPKPATRRGRGKAPAVESQEEAPAADPAVPVDDEEADRLREQLEMEAELAAAEQDAEAETALAAIPWTPSAPPAAGGP